MVEVSGRRFDGKVALVTGGVSGIGAEVTRQLLREGGTVRAVDISAASVERFLADNSDEPRLEASVLDVTDSDVVNATVSELAASHGRLDVLIANAGIGAGGGVADLTDEEWRRVLSVDLDGVFFTARAALPHLIASHGAIVSTASISALGGDQRLAAYNAAKAAVVNLTRSMAVDYGPQGVRVNAVAPGPVDTPMFRPVLDSDPRIAEFYRTRIPLGRVAQPEEIASSILFLASSDASYVSGVTLPVDGGFTASNAQPSPTV